MFALGVHPRVAVESGGVKGGAIFPGGSGCPLPIEVVLRVDDIVYGTLESRGPRPSPTQFERQVPVIANVLPNANAYYPKVHHLLEIDGLGWIVRLVYTDVTPKLKDFCHVLSKPYYLAAARRFNGNTTM